MEAPPHRIEKNYTAHMYSIQGFFKFFWENNACKNKGKGGEIGGYMRERTMLQYPMHFAPKIPFLAICKGPC